MKSTDYKEKIRKLLALAESPNENEAKAALLKARELMAEHKLTEREVKDVEPQDVEKVITDITCSKRRNPWIVNLSVVIGENYCCKSYRNQVYKKQTCAIGFIGFKDDVEICTAIFQYAVDCVLAEVKRIKKEKGRIYVAEYVKRLCNSYGYGFVIGVRDAFEKQKEEHEQGWGLVLLMPKEVEEAAKEMKKEKFRARAQQELYDDEYSRGYRQGKQFDPTKRIARV